MTDDRQYRLGLSDLLEQDFSRRRSPSRTWLLSRKYRNTWPSEDVKKRNKTV